MRSVSRKVQIALSKDEIDARIAQACEASAEIMQMERDKRAYLKKLRARSTELRKTMGSLLIDVERGRVDCEVMCEMKKNFDIGRVEYWHQGKMVDCRPMLEEDRQIELVEASESQSYS